VLFPFILLSSAKRGENVSSLENFFWPMAQCEQIEKMGEPDRGETQGWTVQIPPATSKSARRQEVVQRPSSFFAFGGNGANMRYRSSNQVVKKCDRGVCSGQRASLQPVWDESYAKLGWIGMNREGVGVLTRG
jgi:hypothetical protein